MALALYAHAVPIPCPRRTHIAPTLCTYPHRARYCRNGPPRASCDAAQVRMAAQRTGWAASAASSAVSGEGLMCFFKGPGRIWLQTHKPRLEPGAKGGGRRKPANGESAVACVICMLFFFGILVLGLMFVAPAAFVNGPRGSWAQRQPGHMGTPRTAASATASSESR